MAASGVAGGKRGLCGQDGGQWETVRQRLTEEVVALAAAELATLVTGALEWLHGDGGQLLESVERLAQETVARIGVAAVAAVSNLAGEHPEPTTVCPAGHHARLVQTRTKQVRTLLGGFELSRGYYYCDQCQTGFAPVDNRLGVTGTGLSPGLARSCALAGMEMPYARAGEVIATVAGVKLASAKTIERTCRAQGDQARRRVDQELADVLSGCAPPEATWATHTTPDKCYVVMDGTGAPMLPCETRGRQAKDASGRASTREVKIGAFFTQTGRASQPVQDPGSSTYVSTFAPADQFKQVVKAEFKRRRFGDIRQPVIIGDGAKWIWNIADELFPEADQIVDYYHAREHLADLVKLVNKLIDDPAAWEQTLINRLDLGDTPGIAQAVEELNVATQAPDLATSAAREVSYFTSNHHRMQYSYFLAHGYFIGSGFVESACNTIVKQRAKRAGMHWTIRGLTPVLTLRTLYQSGRTEIIWHTPTHQTRPTRPSRARTRTPQPNPTPHS